MQTVPDQAQFTLGVETSGATARVALDVNAQRMSRVLAALQEAGVAKEDVQTQDVSVSKMYVDEGDDRYSAHNSVSVTIRELSKAGVILDAASNAGANDIYGPSLSRSDEDEQQAKALRAAVDDARAKARVLAEAAGVRLGPVTAITENGNPPEPYYTAALAKRSADAPIEPGRQQVQATVRVTFAIG